MRNKTLKTILSVALGLLLFFVSSLPSIAGANINVEYVRKSVVFLYAADDNGNVGEALGTGFIVVIPLISNPAKAYKFLVTARHIPDPNWAGCRVTNPSKILMRVNTKDFDSTKGQPGTHDFELTGTNVLSKQWIVSEDPMVDVAIMPLNGSILDGYDVEGLRIGDFPTPEEEKHFKSGDSVVSAGLMPGASGKMRNYPIFKFGNVSSIPDEPADTSCGQGTQAVQRKVWFIAASLVPGNSGSPIYYVPDILTTSETVNRPTFLGIQSTSFLGYDVAGMTPANYVYEVIQHIKAADENLERNPQPSKTAPTQPK